MRKLHCDPERHEAQCQRNQIGLQFGTYPNEIFTGLGLTSCLARRTCSLCMEHLDFLPPLCFPKFDLRKVMFLVKVTAYKSHAWHVEDDTCGGYGKQVVSGLFGSLGLRLLCYAINGGSMNPRVLTKKSVHTKAGCGPFFRCPLWLKPTARY